MNITKKIIITDTNIITDLNIAHILNKFVSLDNVYISDLIKYDEINNQTGDLEVINKFKVIKSSDKDIIDALSINKKEVKLSIYDANNFVLAKKHNGILATGDSKLRNYAMKNGIPVIRTLKIIELLLDNKIISKEESLNACNLLKNNTFTRIPIKDIDNLINKLKKE